MFSRIRAIALGFTLTVVGFSSVGAALAVPAVQPAADPMDLSSQQIFDPDNKLGDTGIYQVKSAIDAAQNLHMSVYVAIIPDYGDLSPQEWNAKTLEMSQLPENSYLLSIAYNPNEDGVGEIAASAVPGSVINSAQVSDRAMQVLPYQLSNGEYAAGVTSFVQQLMDLGMANTAGGQPEPTGDVAGNATNGWFILMLVLAMLVAVALAIAIYRRNSYSTSATRRDDSIDFDAVEQADHDEEIEGEEPLASPNAAPALPEASGESLAPAGTTPQTAVPADLFAPATRVEPNIKTPQHVETTAVAPTGNEGAAPAMPQEIDEATAARNDANFDRSLQALDELTNTIYAATEDLRATKATSDKPEIQEFSAALQKAKHQASALMAELAGADFLTDDQADFMVDTANSSKHDLSVQVVKFTKLRHDPTQVAQTLNHLAAAWNKTRKSLTGADSIVKELEANYPQANIRHATANLNQSKRLLKASYKGIVTGQTQMKAGYTKTAIRYARGAERAIMQAQISMEHIQGLQSFLEETRNYLGMMAQKLQRDLQNIHQLDPEANDRSLAIAQRTIAGASDALAGQSDQIAALTKMCAAQAGLYQAYGDSALRASLPAITAEFPQRLAWEEKHLNLIRTNLLLRRKHVDPQLQVELSRCEQLIVQAKEKMSQNPVAAMTILSTCAEMLVQLDSEISTTFSK